jgi:hypothetical protein
MKIEDVTERGIIGSEPQSRANFSMTFQSPFPVEQIRLSHIAHLEPIGNKP